MAPKRELVIRIPGDPGVSTLTTPGFVYFVQGGDGGLIKIGWASHPEARLMRMQPVCPVILRILHREPGNGEQERKLHVRFGAWRKHGEWFEPCDELLAYIAERIDAAPVEYQPAPRQTYIPKGRKPPPVNWLSKGLRDTMYLLAGG